jgi:hypothetical protein
LEGLPAADELRRIPVTKPKILLTADAEAIPDEPKLQGLDVDVGEDQPSVSLDAPPSEEGPSL